MQLLGILTMEIMEEDIHEPNVIRVQNLHRWPSDSDLVHFLSATTSADNLSELKRV